MITKLLNQILDKQSELPGINSIRESLAVS